MIRLAIVLLLFPSMAMAAIPDCFRHEDLVNRLQREYLEAPVEFGLTANGLLMELFTTESGSTWTLAAVDANGCVSVVAAGEYWTMISTRNEEIEN